MVNNAQMISDLISQNEVDVLVFDFDGTLYESKAGIEYQLRPLMAKHAARELNVSTADAIVILRKYRALYKSSVIGLHKYHGIDPEEFLNGVYSNIDITRVTSRLGLYAELHRLQKIIPISIFTNSNKEFTSKIIKLLGLEGLFSTVLTVEDNNFIRKPELEAYTGMYKILNVYPERVIMFDDITSNLRVVHSLGSKTVLVSNGLRAQPNFVDLHTGEEYSEAPSFVDTATHDLVNFLSKVNSKLEI